MENGKKENNLHIIAGICREALSTKNFFFLSVNKKRRNYPKVVLITDKGLMWFF